MEKVDLQRSTHEDLFITKRHQLEGCTNPIHEAHGIPNEYYTRSECFEICLLYTSPSPRDRTRSRMPSSA